MIRAGALAGPDEVERFLRQAEATANLPASILYASGVERP